MVAGGNRTLELIIAARERTRKAFDNVKRQMQGVKKSAGGLSGAMTAVENSISKVSPVAGKLVASLGPLGLAGVAVVATAALVGMGAAAVKSFTAFEDSMANVRKTTGMTKDQIKDLGNSIDGMTSALPVAHSELAKIAAIAGQLGINSKQDILGFTEDIAKMMTAFDMSAESAATAMAKMSNIYNIPIENVSALGSAINVLGNTTAAQESQIMDFSMSLGAAAKQLGFGATESIAMGATLISMGMDASASGTRLNSAFTQMAKNTDKVSKFLGKTEVEFKAAFGEDPMAMVTEITTKLALIEDPLERSAAAAEMFGLIGAKSINALSGDLEGLRTNLANASTGMEENTSLTEEFAAKTDTLKAKFALVGNATESLKINIGEALAPLAGALATGAIAAVSGLSKAFDLLQKVSGPVLGLLLLQFTAFKALLEGLFTPIIDALKPLGSLFEDTRVSVDKLNLVLKVMSDVTTIITGVAKTLGSILGAVVANAITPLVAKLKEGIEALTEFYDKLGPIKGLIEGIKGKVGAGATAIGEWADSFREAAPAAEELTEAVSELTEEAEKMEPALIESIKTLESSLSNASGSYKTAIGDITKEIDTLKDAWNLASDDQKKAIEDQIDSLEDIKSELEKGEEAQKAYFDTAIEGTEEAAEAQKEFKVTIGETTITFKDMAAEVVKNAKAYADLQKNAEQLLALDWSVFSKLEAKLPAIDAGISDMSSAFSGLKDVLNENITELETVKESVMDIGEIAAPFIEAGFLEGINAIGNFAGALSDAGAAINTFGNIQEVNIQGCKDFSHNIKNMVTALELLENQIGDLVPSFERMGELTTAIAKGFIGDTSYINETGEAAKYLGEIFEDVQKHGSMWDIDAWGHGTYGQLSKLMKYMGTTGEQAQELIQRLGPDLQAEIAKLGKESNNASDFIKKLNESSLIMGLRLDINTSKLKLQTGQLVKITDALTPYLNFMRTLNELAALSAVSSEDLNRGLTAIMDTLDNFSKALSTFDITSIFEWIKKFALEWSKYVAGMGESFTTFEDAISTITRLIDNITSLTTAFADMNDIVIPNAVEMEAALSRIPGIIKDITEFLGKKTWTDISANISVFALKWDAINDGISTTTDSFSHFVGIITKIISACTGMARIFTDMGETIVITSDEIAEGLKDIPAVMEEVTKYLTTDSFKAIEQGLINLNAGYKEHAEILDNVMPSYESAFGMFSTLAGNVISLSEAFKELNESASISSINMDRAMGRINTFILRFTEQLRLNLSALVASLTDLDAEWSIHGKAMEKIMPTYKTATGDVGTLISTLLSLTGAFKSLVETGAISSTKFDTGFSSIIASVANFTKSLQKNVDALIISLSNMRTAWLENETTLVPLMRDFRTITRNLISLAVNANLMSDAFSEFSKNSGRLRLGFERLIAFINQVVEATKKFYTPESATAIAKYVTDIGLVIYAFRYLAEQLEKATSNVENEVKDTVENVSGTVRSLKTLIPDMFGYGASAIVSFAAGMNAFKWVLEGVLISISNMIRDYLGVSSNTKLGALSAVEDWPKNLVKTFSEGINAEMGALNNSFGAMMSPSIAGGGGNRTSIVFQVTQNISDKPTADYSTRELERMINKHQVL